MSGPCRVREVEFSYNQLLTRYRHGGGETICPGRWQFDDGISFRRESGHLRQSTDPKIATDLRPSADRSAVRTFLVAGGGLAAGSQHAYSLGSCAMRQADGRIALFQNVPLGRDIITHRLGSFW